MTDRAYQKEFFHQISRIGKAVSAPARLEILQILAQGERAVDSLAMSTALSVANTSRHLRILREAGMVEARKEGVCVYYRTAGATIGRLCNALIGVAESRLAEFERTTRNHLYKMDGLEPMKKEDLVERIRSGRTVILDVRPIEEYRAGHIPGAVSIPLEELESRLSELPGDQEIIAYCRGPYCIMSYHAMEILRRNGLRSRRLEGGFPQWIESGLPVAQEV